MFPSKYALPLAQGPWAWGQPKNGLGLSCWSTAPALSRVKSMSPAASEAPLSRADLADERETVMRSLTVGPQSDSRHENAPAWVFGSGDRSGAFTNQGGGGKRSVGLSPGPIYLPSPRGREGPKYSIGGAASQLETHRRAGGLPGPGEYADARPGAFSKSQTSNRSNTGFGGTSSRVSAFEQAANRAAANASSHLAYDVRDAGAFAADKASGSSAAFASKSSQRSVPRPSDQLSQNRLELRADAG